MVAIKRSIECESCGVEVETIRTTTRFCSDRCRLRARKIRENGRKYCQRCKEPIAGLQNVVYCSSECREMYRISKRTIRLVRIRCLGCSRQKLVRHKRSYCSPSCNTVAWYQKNKDRLNAAKALKRNVYSIKCRECGKHFSSTKSNRSYCSYGCGERYYNRRKEALRREKITSNGPVDWSISIERLAKRDGRGCYICGDKMNFKVDYNHDNYPNIEHVKPISKGGTHTWDNVKLAHRICNMKKSDHWID